MTKVLKRIIILLLLLNFLFLIIFLIINLKISSFFVEINNETNKNSKYHNNFHSNRLVDKNGKVVEFGINTISQIANREKEDRFEISGVVDSIWVEKDKVYLRIFLPTHNLKLTFEMGKKEDIIGVNGAKKGKIGIFKADKIRNVFPKIIRGSQIVVDVISKVDENKIDQKICDFTCKDKIKYINSNYSKYSKFLLALSKSNKRKNFVSENKPIALIAQIVYYEK